MIDPNEMGDYRGGLISPAPTYRIFRHCGPLSGWCCLGGAPSRHAADVLRETLGGDVVMRHPEEPGTEYRPTRCRPAMGGNLAGKDADAIEYLD